MKLSKVAKNISSLIILSFFLRLLIASFGISKEFSTQRQLKQIEKSNVRRVQQEWEYSCRGEIIVEIRSQQKIPSFAFTRSISLIDSDPEGSQDILYIPEKEMDILNPLLRTYKKCVPVSISCFRVQIVQGSYYHEIFGSETYVIFYNGFQVESGEIGGRVTVTSGTIGSTCLRTSMPSVLSSDHPSLVPTSRPTASPSTLAKYMGKCTPYEKCGLCEADCDSSDSCKSDLKCVHVASLKDPTTVGCSSIGSDSEIQGKRICVRDDSPPIPSLFIRYAHECTPNRKCGLCEAGCRDSSNNCEEGLVCVQRKNYEAVQGCSGNGSASDFRGSDVCAKPLIRSGKCHKNKKYKCGLCEGNCNSHDECEYGLECKSRERFESVDGCVGEGLKEDIYGMNVCAPPALTTGSPSESPSAAITSNPSQDFPSEDEFIDLSPISPPEPIVEQKSFIEIDNERRRFPRINYLNDSDWSPSDLNVSFPLIVKDQIETKFSPEKVVSRDKCAFLFRDNLSKDGLIDFLCVRKDGSFKFLLEGSSFEYNYTIDSNPLTVTGAILMDINGDREKDLILSFQGTGKFSTCIRNGTKFSQPTHSEIERKPIAFTACDINDDKRADIVFLEHNNTSVFVLLNNGSGISEEVKVLHNTAVPFVDIVGGNLMNETLCDLVLVSNQEEVSNIVLTKNWDKEQWQEHDLPRATQNSARKNVYLGNLDGDDYMDIIVTTYGGKNQVIFNHGTLPFDKMTTVELPGGNTFTSSVSLGDLSGNGLLDIIASSEGFGDEIILNQGHQQFQSIGLLSSERSKTILIADMTGDRAVDLLLAKEDRVVLRNNMIESERFQYLGKLPGSENTESYSLSVGDYNNDGYIDIVAGNWNAENQILINDGNGNFDQTLFGELTDQTFQVELVDLNGDECLDIIALNKGVHSEWKLQTMMNDNKNCKSNSTEYVLSSTPTTISPSVEPTSMPSELPSSQTVSSTLEEISFVTGKFNNDTFTDILIIGGNSSGCILINNGAGAFQKCAEFSLPTRPYVAAAVGAFQDQEHGVMLDVILAHDDFTWELFLNEEGKGWRKSGKYNLIVEQSILSITSIAIGDVNRDGDLDVLFSISQADRFTAANETFDQIVYGPLNPTNRNESMSSARNLQESVVPQNTTRIPLFVDANETFTAKSHVISLFDVNNDGWLDIVVGTGLGVPNFILYNDESGNYTKENFVSIEGSGIIEWKCEDVAVADIMGTGRNDIIFAHSERSNELYSHATCPNGGAQLHRSSWCFKCPDFMGLSSPNSGICVECLPDHVQETFSEMCSTTICPFKHQELGEDSCEFCPHGMYYDSTLNRLANDASTWKEKRCRACGNGTFAINDETQKNIDECEICPYPLTTRDPTSTICDVCNATFFLDSPFPINVTELNLNPTEYCKPCPRDMTCNTNTNITNIEIRSGYWRESSLSKTIYECFDEESCNHRNSKAFEDYCQENKKGPLCQLCADPNHYYKNGKCRACPSEAVLFILSLLLIACILGVTSTISRYFKAHRMSVVPQVLVSLNVQTKMKMLVGFFQVVASLPIVYGVALDKHFRSWFDMSIFFSLDVFEFIPFDKTCYGSTVEVYTAGAIWPFVLLAMIGLVLLATKLVVFLRDRYIYTRNKNSNAVSSTIDRMPYERLDSTAHQLHGNSYDFKRFLQRCVVLVLFYTIPTVCTSIFDAKKCVSFLDQITFIDTDVKELTSFLRADLTIECNDENKDNTTSQKLDRLFLIFSLLWLCFIPILFFVFLSKIQRSVSLHRPSSLAITCRFLWQDFNEASVVALYWDFIDTIKKIALTGFINLIDIRDGNDKLLRSIVAIVLLIIFLVLLIYVRPYKRSDDMKLAVVSNTFLLICFSMSIILHHCELGSRNTWYLQSLEKYSEGGACELFVSSKLNSKHASVAVIISMVAMLFVTIFMMLFLSGHSPILRLKKTGYPPDMHMTRDCSYHVFMSHRWDSGQDATHAIARKLQLYLNALRVWLDVDNLSSTGELENCVQHTSVFLLVYTKNYFQSWNCRREFLQALQLKKPIIVIYNADETAVCELKEECNTHCNYQGIQEIVADSNKGLRNDSNDQAALFTSNISSSTVENSYVVREISNELKNFIRKCENDLIAIEWMKVGKFSLESLKLIYQQILQELPFYQAHRYLLDPGLYLPEEANPKSLYGLIASSPSVKLVFPGLFEANTMIEDLRILCLLEFEDKLDFVPAEKQNGRDGGDSNESIVIEMKTKHSRTMREVAILYLHNTTLTFHPAYNIIQEIEELMERDVPIILVHEKDSDMGGCDFIFKEQVEFLGMSNKKAQILFREIAIPLYKRPEYRRVSLQAILEKVLSSSKNKTSKSKSLKKCMRKMNVLCTRDDELG